MSGTKQLDGLRVDQGPEVLKGNVLTVLNTHLLQELTQTLLVVSRLQQETGSGDEHRHQKKREKRGEGGGWIPKKNQEDILRFSWWKPSEDPNLQKKRKKLDVQVRNIRLVWRGGCYLGNDRQLLGHHGLELGGVHGGSIICSLVELCDQCVDGQLQV